MAGGSGEKISSEQKKGRSCMTLFGEGENLKVPIQYLVEKMSLLCRTTVTYFLKGLTLNYPVWLIHRLSIISCQIEQ